MDFVRAPHFYVGRLAPIRVVVIHATEAPEGPQTAENVANYFHTTANQVSAHVCADSNTRVRCVADTDTAWAAPGCNSDGLQLELAGYSNQSTGQWQDAYSRGVLQQGAAQVADWCTAWNIPARWLTQAELQQGLKGITTHNDVSAVYKRSDHTDPGPHFPKAAFLLLVKAALGVADDRIASAAHAYTAPPPPPAWPGRVLRLISPMMSGTDVRQWQRRMRARGWSITVDGVYGPQSKAVALRFQREKRIAVTGVVDKSTWTAAWVADIT